MKTLYLILYIIAAVLFAIAIVAPAPRVEANTPSAINRVNLVAAGLFAWVLAPLIHQIDAMND